eukprot:scaffold91472_cov31-Tisochrysis_lutea.AAC.6
MDERGWLNTTSTKEHITLGGFWPYMSMDERGGLNSTSIDEHIIIQALLQRSVAVVATESRFRCTKKHRRSLIHTLI